MLVDLSLPFVDDPFATAQSVVCERGHVYDKDLSCGRIARDLQSELQAFVGRRHFAIGRNLIPERSQRRNTGKRKGKSALQLPHSHRDYEVLSLVKA